MKRLKAASDMERRRRRIVAKVLRAMGLKHRTSQRAFLEQLQGIGLHPDTFTLGINTIAELKVDMQEWIEELLHYEDVRRTLTFHAMALHHV